MLRHADIWAAIDRLARDRGLTASGLARRAGLDPTTFNKSKRITREGKPRWPSTESISKVLDATGASLDEFITLLSDQPANGRGPALPLVPSADILSRRTLNGTLQAHLRGSGGILFPDAGKSGFAIAMSDDRLAPAYRKGDVLIVSNTVRIRRGDRVLARTAVGETIAAEVVRNGRGQLVMRRLDRPVPQEMSCGTGELAWMLRVLWASQ